MKEDYMQLFYGEYYKKWFDMKDDRKYFCNLYEQILAMENDKKFVKSPSSKVAINKEMIEYEEKLKEIINRFETR